MRVKQPPDRFAVVPATMRLDRLHDTIQAAMGWESYHLHAFSAGGVDHGPPDPEARPRGRAQDAGQ